MGRASRLGLMYKEPLDLILILGGNVDYILWEESEKGTGIHVVLILCCRVLQEEKDGAGRNKAGNRVRGVGGINGVLEGKDSLLKRKQKKNRPKGCIFFPFFFSLIGPLSLAVSYLYARFFNHTDVMIDGWILSYKVVFYCFLFYL
ncbi:hypothetical protein F5X96DRAFT_335018 [Biscogniauxia mediterranea]|nr:hypothetical protein F5X96DRAFT_335018 [Biscogniauxia mediterranea]